MEGWKTHRQNQKDPSKCLLICSRLHFQSFPVEAVSYTHLDVYKRQQLTVPYESTSKCTGSDFRLILCQFAP